MQRLPFNRIGYPTAAYVKRSTSGSTNAGVLSCTIFVQNYAYSALDYIKKGKTKSSMVLDESENEFIVLLWIHCIHMVYESQNRKALPFETDYKAGNHIRFFEYSVFTDYSQHLIWRNDQTIGVQVLPCIWDKEKKGSFQHLQWGVDSPPSQKLVILLQSTSYFGFFIWVVQMCTRLLQDVLWRRTVLIAIYHILYAIGINELCVTTQWLIIQKNKFWTTAQYAF